MNDKEGSSVHNPSPATTTSRMDQCSAEPHMIGYARVSTDDQDLSLQIDALTKQGIPSTAIFMDKLSEAKTERPGLSQCLETLQSGRNGGRPKLTNAAARVVLAKKLHADKSLEIDDIGKPLRISRSTFYRYVRL